MAFSKKTLVDADMKQLTISGTFGSGKFAVGTRDVMKVKDEQTTLIWDFQYRVKSRSEVVISGDWEKFIGNNRVQRDHEVAIHRNDQWCSSGAAYKIEVIKGGLGTN